MTSIDKKAALAAYKERKTAAGVFVIRCALTGQAWVGQAPNLDTIQNRIWFSLRQGGTVYPEMQAAWREHGPDALGFEVLETVTDEAAYVRAVRLKERVAHWREALGAGSI